MGQMIFKKYRRTSIAEMRDIGPEESIHQLQNTGVSIANVDAKLPWGKFSKGKVARNPDNHKDKWYVAEDYFNANFEEV